MFKALLLFISLTSVLIAAPDALTSKLLNHSVSRLEFGCYRLILALHSINPDNPDRLPIKIDYDCRYDEKTDTIQINANLQIPFKERDGRREYQKIHKNQIKKYVKALLFPIILKVNMNVSKYFGPPDFGSDDLVLNEDDWHYIIKKFRLNFAIEETPIAIYVFTGEKSIMSGDQGLLFYDYEHAAIN